MGPRCHHQVLGSLPSRSWVMRPHLQSSCDTFRDSSHKQLCPHAVGKVDEPLHELPLFSVQPLLCLESRKVSPQAWRRGRLAPDLRRLDATRPRTSPLRASRPNARCLRENALRASQGAKFLAGSRASGGGTSSRVRYFELASLNETARSSHTLERRPGHDQGDDKAAHESAPGAAKSRLAAALPRNS